MKYRKKKTDDYKDRKRISRARGRAGRRAGERTDGRTDEVIGKKQTFTQSKKQSCTISLCILWFWRFEISAACSAAWSSFGILCVIKHHVSTKRQESKRCCTVFLTSFGQNEFITWIVRQERRWNKGTAQPFVPKPLPSTGEVILLKIFFYKVVGTSYS